MRVTARQRQILSQLRDGSYVEVKDLAERLGVDGSTIRRDLQPLVRDGMVERLHGGARLSQAGGVPAPGPADEGEALSMAQVVARLIQPGDTLALGPGRVSDELARLLRAVPDITVVTNDLRLAAELSHHRQARVLVAGGELRDTPDRCAASGPATTAFLEGQRCRWAIIEVEGLDPYAGLTTSSPWLVAPLRSMLQIAERRVVLAPTVSVGVRCVGFIADTSGIDIIISGDGVPDRDLPAFGGKVLRAAAEPDRDWHWKDSGLPGWRRRP